MKQNNELLLDNNGLKLPNPDNKIILNTSENHKYISFMLNSCKLLELRENGDIFVKEKLIENDKEVVTALREFLKIK